MIFITKDEGEHETFSSGAKRDSQEGKARIDLIEPEFWFEVLTDYYTATSEHDNPLIVLARLTTGVAMPSAFVYLAVSLLAHDYVNYDGLKASHMAAVTFRFGELMARGAEKYEENNWKTVSEGGAGIPNKRVLQSLQRHMCQFLTEVEDGEDHLAAVLFNCMAMWWNVKREENENG